ncbi:MAG: winged helix DNA-binding protein [Lachnospiraceae bacterium]|jgi:DNA-binding MarR family transcriptional regulator|nr:winged helix DNA-binding protein [Lachnospiraceae bacterium]
MTTAEEMFSLRYTQAKGMNNLIALNTTGGEDGMMLWLYLCGKDQTVAGDLADALNLTSGRIANILRQLERKNYVMRTNGRVDRRKVYVALTPEGKRHTEEVYKAILAKYQNLIDAIGEDEAKEYLRLNKLILEKLSQE